MKKTLQPTNELFIQFSDEEVQELGLERGQRYEVKLKDDGAVELRPYVKVELNIGEWPREVLEMIIKKSLDEDISANDVINNVLREGLELYKEQNEDYSAADMDPNFTNNDTSITYSKYDISTASHDMLYNPDAK